MRRLTRALTIFLALLMVSASASTANCDVQCLRPEAHSCCDASESGDMGHSAAMSMVGMDMSASQNAGSADMGAMDMPSMDMHSRNDGGATQVPAGQIKSALHHSTLGPMDIARQRSKDKISRGAKTADSFSREAVTSSHQQRICSEISLSASPPNGDPPKDHFLHVTVIRTAGVARLDGSIHDPGIAVPLLGPPSHSRYITNLRI